MLLFRAVRAKDAKDILHLAGETGVGITTLPHDKKVISGKIHSSLEASAKKIETPIDELYFFALEDTSINKVVGVCAIDTGVGKATPFYSYKINSVTRICNDLNIRNDYQTLTLVNDFHGKTEVCTLFLSEKYRHSGIGKFLSLSRFMFMAAHPERITDLIFADMRGISDENGRSPFWESLGKHFFKMSYAEADRLTSTTNKQFIADLMPRNPIYPALLSKKAQAVIGQPHRSTIPALKILQHQGFQYHQYVDIFDAGPTMEVEPQNVKLIKEARHVTIAAIKPVTNQDQFLIALQRMPFACARASIDIHTQDTIVIDNGTAKLLSAEIGERVIISLFAKG